MRDCLGVPHPRDWPHSALRDSSVTMPPDERLSPREIEIASAYAQGDTYQMIAARHRALDGTHASGDHLSQARSVHEAGPAHADRGGGARLSVDRPAAPPRQAVDRRSGVPEHVRGSRSGVFLGRDSPPTSSRRCRGLRGCSSSPATRPSPTRGRMSICAASRPTWRPLRPRRQRSARRRQGSGHGATDRRADGRACLVRQL